MCLAPRIGIEADGRRLFYSGDLRGHGRDRGVFERLLSAPPADVDAVLVEGTCIPDAGPARRPWSENVVEDAMVETFRRTEGLALVCLSSQNIDRIVTTYEAARRAGRRLLVDLYTATILEAVDHPSVPRLGWPDPARNAHQDDAPSLAPHHHSESRSLGNTTRYSTPSRNPLWRRGSARSSRPPDEQCGLDVFLTWDQRNKIVQTQEYYRVSDPLVKAHRVFHDRPDFAPGRYAMVFRSSMIPLLVKADCLAGARCIWSLWRGYLDEPRGQRFQRWLDRAGIRLAHHHSSGHAGAADLVRLVDALPGADVVPIHTEGRDRFAELLPHRRVTVRDDGVWWKVGRT